jgi:ABC-2 type transport system ATP-binding protein
MIEVHELTKRYGGKLAVDALSFRVHPGRVTGFLGPNGAGKSTTMRLILGLDTPTSGRATVNGRPYRQATWPLREVGALLDARAVHPGRTTYHHLRYLAASNGLSRGRVDEVLDLAGLTSAANKRAGGLSLGMTQRLGIAAALLGDPATLILDEPVNGLDTDGIRWIRGLLRELAGHGRTVLLSSHLMSEMERTADHLIVIGGGRLLADTGMRRFIADHSQDFVVVRSAAPHRLTTLLQDHGATVGPDPDGGWQVRGLDAAAIGELAAAHHVVLHELTPRQSTLEDVYTGMVDPAVAYRSGALR